MRVTHLLGEDVVGHIHHTALIVTEAFDFGHYRGLDGGVGHLISFLMDKDPAAGTHGLTDKFISGRY